MPAALAQRVRPRVLRKLQTEAVEDLRIDFEDGYGVRPDDEEDGHAVGCARAVARGRADGTLPPFIGIRIKSMIDETSWIALSARSTSSSPRCCRASGDRCPPASS